MRDKPLARLLHASNEILQELNVKSPLKCQHARHARRDTLTKMGARIAIGDEYNAANALTSCLSITFDELSQVHTLTYAMSILVVTRHSNLQSSSNWDPHADMTPIA